MLVCMLVGLSAPHLIAQSNFASAAGVVTDPQNQPVQGADIRVESTTTGVIRTATTNESGLYELPNLAPGSYKVSFSAVGFAPVERISPVGSGTSSATRLFVVAECES